MNRHGRRFIELRDFKSHASALNVKFLNDDELEFYEKHCLLVPQVRLRRPLAHLIAATQKGECWPVENPEDLEPPEALRSLRRPRTDGLHPFDAVLDATRSSRARSPLRSRPATSSATGTGSCRPATREPLRGRVPTRWC